MRFIDEEYDGLIINLPNWFIDINGLTDIIEDFKQKIENKVTLSTMFGDYTHSLHELENYKTKKKYSEEKKRLDIKRKEELDVYYSKRVNKEVIDWNWCEYTFESFYELIKFENETFDPDVFWGKNKRPPAKIISEINEKINNLTDKEFIEFLELNGSHHFSDFELGKHYRRVNNTFYMDRRGFVKFRVEKMAIKYYTDKNTYYPNISIYYNNNEDKYYFTPPGLKNKTIYLDDYIINKNFTLTRK